MKNALLILVVWWVFHGIVGPSIRGQVVDEREEVNLTWTDFGD